MKHITALISALFITIVIGLGVLVIGANAMVNHNTVALQNSPGNGAVNISNGSTADSASISSEIAQLQQQVSDTQAQLVQAEQEIQQYQSLLIALQQRGVIAIGQNGEIYLPQRGESETH